MCNLQPATDRGHQMHHLNALALQLELVCPFKEPNDSDSGMQRALAVTGGGG